MPTRSELGERPRTAPILLVGAMILAVPREARADTYLPFAAGMSEASVLLFVIIVLLEALVLWKMLEASFRAALVTALLANVASTVLGVVLAFCALAFGGPGVDLIGVALMFGTSVLIEGVIVRRRLAVPRNRALAASIAMNVLSYAVLVPAAAYLADRAKEAKRSRYDLQIEMQYSAMKARLDQPSAEPSPVDRHGPAGDAAP